MHVIGYQQVSFTPKGETQAITGVTLYLTEERDKVQGLAADRVFVSARKLGSYFPQLGDEIRLSYNRYGKVDAVELLPQ